MQADTFPEHPERQSWHRVRFLNFTATALHCPLTDIEFANTGDEWKLPEPQWVQTTVNTREGLADAICQAQGAKLQVGGYQCDVGESRPPTAMQITLTGDLSLRAYRLPDIWGAVKIVGACGGVGKRYVHKLRLA